MKELRTEDYPEHIVDSSGDILSFMSLIEIGEAATKISASDPDFVAQNDGLPWSQMRGMRNRIAHGFVWQTVTSAIPALNQQAETLLNNLREGPEPGPSSN